MKWLTGFTGKVELTNKMKIVLVDDHSILLDGLKKLIQEDDMLTVVDAVDNLPDAIRSIDKHKPELVITDYNLGEDDGLSLVQKVKRILPETRFIVLSMHDESHLVKEILKEGINGYVLKKDTKAELLEAIYSVRAGKMYLSSDINAMLVKSLYEPDEGKLLTSREREILQLIAKEYSNKNIAEELFISERTVETHRKNIFRKTKTNSIVGLIKFAYANNLI
ncbi:MULTISPECIES: response regulator [Roseivirga]|jgi:DNA-binding NarL/FixJ family response regulator|uniref:DNA-binding response regulator n=2 Tax=Roseivirga thermotolerans TaxID=1758176 RepID=A0ABQ3HZH9_9BACT|nr:MULTISPECIES: response regulator transcription factor [Roseivirga]GHE50721.1 DNA-binding response regulator [Roseivirga thermotolerans]|tara:strand:- start:18396 stop:19061 length:666 start_codon:yes stop_codon:yes gene_type:complete